MTLNDTLIILIKKVFLQLASEVLPLAEDRPINRDLQSEIMQRMRKLGTLSTSQVFSIKSLSPMAQGPL